MEVKDYFLLDTAKQASERNEMSILTTHKVIDDRVNGAVEVTEPMSDQGEVNIGFTGQGLQDSGISATQIDSLI